MEDETLSRSIWISVDDRVATARGWYAVLRLRPGHEGGIAYGAQYFGIDRWGHNHDIFARSTLTFPTAEAAEAFAATNSRSYRGKSLPE